MNTPGHYQEKIIKLERSNKILLKALLQAKEDIIILTDCERGANKVFYPTYIDKAIKNAKK